MKKPKPDYAARAALVLFLAALGLIAGEWLRIEVARGWIPNAVVASNDGPLGIVAAAKSRVPWSGIAMWDDLNYIGMRGPNTINFTTGVLVLLGHPRWMLAIALTALALFWWSPRLCCIAFSAAIAVSCAGLLIACLSGAIDPYTSEWMSIYPIALTCFPFILMIVLLTEDHESNH